MSYLSDYPDDFADFLCRSIAEGRSLAWCCEQKRVALSSALDFVNRNASIAERYARAREASADKLADEIVSISDDPTLDPNDKRIRVDARKWVAAKLKPRTYGEKVQHTGADGAGPVATEVVYRWAGSEKDGK